MSLICDGNGAQLIAEQPDDPCEQAACHASFDVAPITITERNN
jgi:hypothetical protein